MSLTAGQVMTASFPAIGPEKTVAEAVAAFREAGERFGTKVFGMVVVDPRERLVGMISMYDILLLVQPKHASIWGRMAGLETDGLVEKACARSSGVLVGDIMTTEVITLPPEAHVFMILDLMIKKHIRRIPIVADEKIQGMVYLSAIFEAICELMPGPDKAC